MVKTYSIEISFSCDKVMANTSVGVEYLFLSDKTHEAIIFKQKRVSQMFPTRGDFVPPGDNWQCLEALFGHPHVDCVCYWHLLGEVRSAANHSALPRTVFPHQRIIEP